MDNLEPLDIDRLIMFCKDVGLDAAEVLREACANKLRGVELVKVPRGADVVEVVRCKDCKYKSMESGEFDSLEPACRFWTDADSIYPVFVDMNGFCSEGKRKDGGYLR